MNCWHIGNPADLSLKQSLEIWIETPLLQCVENQERVRWPVADPSEVTTDMEVAPNGVLRRGSFYEVVEHCTAPRGARIKIGVKTALDAVNRSFCANEWATPAMQHWFGQCLNDPVIWKLFLVSEIDDLRAPTSRIVVDVSTVVIRRHRQLLAQLTSTSNLPTEPLTFARRSRQCNVDERQEYDRVETKLDHRLTLAPQQTNIIIAAMVAPPIAIA